MSALLSLLGRRRVDLGDELGGVLVEVLEAILAAEFHLPAFMHEDLRLAHSAGFLTGNRTGIERIGNG